VLTPPHPLLIERYVQTGGHPTALEDRGGLPAEHWALGWHRGQAANGSWNARSAESMGPTPTAIRSASCAVSSRVPAISWFVIR